MKGKKSASSEAIMDSSSIQGHKQTAEWGAECSKQYAVSQSVSIDGGRNAPARRGNHLVEGSDSGMDFERAF